MADLRSRIVPRVWRAACVSMPGMLTVEKRRQRRFRMDAPGATAGLSSSAVAASTVLHWWAQTGSGTLFGRAVSSTAVVLVLSFCAFAAMTYGVNYGRWRFAADGIR